jgi:NIPSNAP
MRQENSRQSHTSAPPPWLRFDKFDVMHRRDFLCSTSLLTASAALSTPLAAAPAPSRSILELRYIHLRTNLDNEMQRTSDFFRNGAPALKRAGISPLGFFSPVIADESPFLLVISSFPSLAAMDTARAAEAADKQYIQSRDAYNSASARGYERIESSLLRCFETMPEIVLPPAPADARPPRIFELRMYESTNATTLARKVHMFNTGEIKIFQRLGMQPVFCAETIVGARMPNLVYMLAFENLAAREKLWQAFSADPEWQKLRSLPGNNDIENVSNIGNAILRPLAFSDIR